MRIAAVGGSEPIASITVKAESYSVDWTKQIGLTVLGAHPSKTSLGPARLAPPNADKTFSYLFTTTNTGQFQVDFTAEGLFANGRRFAAITGVSIFVKRLAASVTAVRQQRIELANDGKPDIARFLVVIDVIQPGTYDVSIGTGKPIQPELFGQQVLAAGKQTMTLKSNRKFLSMLEQNPEDRLVVYVINRDPLPKGEFPPAVAMDAAMPKAGDFTLFNPNQ